MARSGTDGIRADVPRIIPPYVTAFCPGIGAEVIDLAQFASRSHVGIGVCGAAHADPRRQGIWRGRATENPVQGGLLERLVPGASGGGAGVFGGAVLEVGIGALSGCLTGVFQGVSGAAVGIAATAGAILGFAKGFFGGPEIDLSFGF